VMFQQGTALKKHKVSFFTSQQTIIFFKDLLRNF